MKVNGLNFLVTCPPQFDEMSAFFENVMGLTVSSEGTPVTNKRVTRYVQYKLPNGDIVEIVDGDSSMRELLKVPVIQFEVDDVGKARREMERKGVEFVGPLYQSEDEGWTFFKAPNGDVYSIGGKYTDKA